MKKILSLTLAIALMITSFMGFGAVEADGAVGINQISLEPTGSGYNVGDNIIINVKASNINDLYGVQFTLTYDPEFIELLNPVYKEISVPGNKTFKLAQIARNDENSDGLKKVSFALTQSISDEEAIYTGALPEAYICELPFRAISEGSTKISIDDVYALSYEDIFTKRYSPKSELTVQIGGTVQPPAVNKIDITGPDEIIVPATGDVTANYSAAVLDQYGAPMPSESVTWSIEGTAAGVSVDSSGKVTVSSTVSVTSFILKATSVTNSSVSETATITLKKVTPVPVVDSIEISGASKITIPSSGSTTSSYTATVKDKDGKSMPSESVTWSIEGTVAGVSVDSSGKVTVSSSANAGTIKLKATSNSKSSVYAIKEITLEKATVAPPPPPVIIPGTPSGDTSKTSLTLDQIKELIEKLPAGSDLKQISVEIPAAQNCKEYIVEIPALALEMSPDDIKVNVITPLGNIVIPSNMFTESQLKDAGKVGFSIRITDASDLGDDLKKQIGDRPVVELKAFIDGKVVEWENPDAPVQISIPYEPTEEELKDHEHIVVWYIDSKGNAVSVPNGKYDPDTGMVTFTTTHFSRYAVAFVHKSFTDISAYKGEGLSAIEVLASKGIIEGITSTKYYPEEPITRADFLLYLVRGLGLTASFEDNFKDMDKDSKYYEAVGIGKALGITNGNGNNEFKPDKSISRQDMMVMVRRTLKIIGKVTESAPLTELDRFADAAEIAGYAKESVATLVKNGIIKGGSHGINPKGEFRRGEAAMVIYRLYNMD